MRPMRTGAEFSSCRTWRYALWRFWAEGPRIAFIGLNPSTADEKRDDPTLRRCIGFARAWGFGGLYMLNAYAFRATDPAVLKRVADPIGPHQDRRLRSYVTRASALVAAWGVHCEPCRADRICALLRRSLDCLGRTKDGAPCHPLRLKKTTVREPYYSYSVLCSPQTFTSR